MWLPQKGEEKGNYHPLYKALRFWVLECFCAGGGVCVSDRCPDTGTKSLTEGSCGPKGVRIF